LYNSIPGSANGPREDKDGLLVKLENMVGEIPPEEAELEPRSFLSLYTAALVSCGRSFQCSSGIQFE
jgi:hypothetical protein